VGLFVFSFRRFRLAALSVTIVGSSIAALPPQVASARRLPALGGITASELAQIATNQAEAGNAAIGQAASSSGDDLTRTDAQQPRVGEVLVPELSTETRTVFRRADGTLAERISSSPVRFKDKSNKWVDIDPTLEVDRTGNFKAKSVKHPVTVRESFDNDPVIELITPIGTVSAEIELSSVAIDPGKKVDSKPTSSTPPSTLVGSSTSAIATTPTSAASQQSSSSGPSVSTPNEDSAAGRATTTSAVLTDPTSSQPPLSTVPSTSISTSTSVITPRATTDADDVADNKQPKAAKSVKGARADFTRPNGPAAAIEVLIALS
jgi:hypothetical protein